MQRAKLQHNFLKINTELKFIEPLFYTYFFLNENNVHTLHVTLLGKLFDYFLKPTCRGKIIKDIKVRHAYLLYTCNEIVDKV